MIISFELTMPNVGSWNGKWTGEKNKYFAHRTISKKQATELFKDKHILSFYYSFGDGWGANVACQKVDSVKKRSEEKISKGFCGYDWMISEILKYGKILTLQERSEMRKKDGI